MNYSWIFILAASILFLVVLLVASSYLKVKPNQAYIITGPTKSRVVVGKATLRIPFIERVDIINLDLIQVDIKTTSAVPTNEFINIFVDGVANIKVKSDAASVKKAGEIFLNQKLEYIKGIATQSLEGNMREIIGQMKLKELVQNRDMFAEKVRSSAAKDMDQMGLEIINITIQNFSDENNVITDLGVDNISQIRKDASIAKANAEKDVQVATSAAKETANMARIAAELKISEQNNDLALRQADLKQKSETARAIADAAYEIQKAGQLKVVNIATQDAEIAKRDKEVILRESEIKVEERTLDAKVKKTAEAQRYAVSQKADADLYIRTREAEAQLAEQTKQAEAVKLTAMAQADATKAQAEAARFSAEQQAIGIAAIGQAEAEAIDKKAEAMKKMGESSVLELILNSKIVPEMVAAASAPLANVESIKMYGDGNTTKLTKEITNNLTQIIDGIKESTGMDVMSLLAGALGGTLLAKKPENK